MTENISRQPKGVPVGGQFAATTHTEPELSPLTSVTPFHDADGTDWEFGGDEYTDVYNSFQHAVEVRITTDIREDGAYATVTDFRRNRPLVLGDRTHHESLEEAKAHGKAIRERANSYEHNHIGEGSRSPWGKLQGVDPVAVGIDAVWTERHGGFKLSPERAAEVDPAWREVAGWYEQDCAWAKAIITHHQDLKPADVAGAHKAAREYYPDEYTAIVGKDPAKYGLASFQPITAAESSIIETREFLAARADTHVRVERVNLTPEGHSGMVSVDVHDIPADGRDEEDSPAVNARTILVPEQEWKMPWTERRTIPKSDAYQTLELA
ncbi:hypothetical protein IV500_05230 [Paeniglutamicibacter antarcticus]|uniref:DUF7007 domain-containing protein n=1 Tax=Arthrobacter terrae TaxID=2935737 RepID=A0A931G9M2_9MICC|nr:hypothetical protein [Arthrobacter terrae]MBG0738822.1 hypothetical protein [Arthrobacter terrae]